MASTSTMWRKPSWMKVARVFIVSYLRRTGSIGLLRIMKAAVHGHRRGLGYAGSVSELAVRVLSPALQLSRRRQGAHVGLAHVDRDHVGDAARFHGRVRANEGRYWPDRGNARVT